MSKKKYTLMIALMTMIFTIVPIFAYELTENTKCKEQHDLFQRPNGMFACITQQTADILGWISVPDTQNKGTWIPQEITPDSDHLIQQYSTSESASLGLAVGGAQDVNNFRENIKNNYLPVSSDITYEGLFYDYYFDTGAKQKCEKLFCPSYSYAISKDPFSEKDQYYLSVGLNSGIKESDFERKKLNLVIVLDVSGSMDSPFNQYYYDQFSNKAINKDESDWSKTKMDIAKESIVGLVDHLNKDDNLGIVLFDNEAHISKPLESIKYTNVDSLKKNILEIRADGGTNMEIGMTTGTSLFKEQSDPSEYENRIIFLTDAMPNQGNIGQGHLLDIIKKNAQRNIYTSAIGIGVDFNTELVDYITKVSGANYYSVHSSVEFKQRMVDEFDFMVTPLVFDLTLHLESDGYDIIKVYGSPESDESTGEIMRVNTLFPSKVKDSQTKGGIIILKLEKTSDDSTITLQTNYKDRAGKADSDTIAINFNNDESNVYENSGIRKAILLARYAELVKTWTYEQRNEYGNSKEPIYPESLDTDGIHTGYHMDNLGLWERESIPLEISPRYKDVFEQFSNYFEKEMEHIGDQQLAQEISILDKLKRHI